MPLEKQALFERGKLFCSPAVMDVVPRVKIATSLSKHLSGDWGECCPADASMNDWAVRDGFCVCSVYQSYDGTEFWITTDGDRSSTHVLLPSEY